MFLVRARFDGRVFVPKQPVSLPAETEVDLAVAPKVETVAEVPPLLKLAEMASQFPDDPDMPTDASMQFDHYLYGLPKGP